MLAQYGELGITLRFREAEAERDFLMASAVGLENLEPTSPKPIAEKTLLVHGWNDEVVPVANAINFARNYQVPLHLLPTDHRLITQLDCSQAIFQNFLQQCLESQKDGDPRSSGRRNKRQNSERKYQTDPASYSTLV